MTTFSDPKISKAETDIFKTIQSRPDAILGHDGLQKAAGKPKKKPRGKITAAEHPGIARLIDEINVAAGNAHGATPSESWPVYPATTPKTGQMPQQAQRAPGHSTYQHQPSAAAMNAGRNAQPTQPNKAVAADQLRKFDNARRPMSAAEIADLPIRSR